MGHRLGARKRDHFHLRQEHWGNLQETRKRQGGLLAARSIPVFRGMGVHSHQMIGRSGLAASRAGGEQHQKSALKTTTTDIEISEGRKARGGGKGPYSSLACVISASIQLHPVVKKVCREHPKITGEAVYAEKGKF